MRKMVGIVIAMIMFPWLVSLAWSGAARGAGGGITGETWTEDAGDGMDSEENPGMEGNGQAEESANAGVVGSFIFGKRGKETAEGGDVEANAAGSRAEGGRWRADASAGNTDSRKDGDAGAGDNGNQLPGGVSSINKGSGERRVLVERRGIQTYIELEDYLPGVIVCQISQECGMEALKCQAVIARTYIYRLMDGRSEIWEEELDLDYLSESQQNTPWDKEKTAQYLGQCRQAAADTAGVVMQYEGREILPLFHAVSAGRTRTGDESYPYLKSAESRWDTQREDYLQTMEWGLPAFAGLINAVPGAAAVTAEQLPAQIQTVKKDDAGYIVQMKVGAKTYTGEEIQYALGLPSSCFTFEGNSEGIKAVVKGIGHGFGLSQAGADAMAGEGWGYQDILNYYYKGIALESP